jgi:hypothetical protein
MAVHRGGRFDEIATPWLKLLAPARLGHNQRANITAASGPTLASDVEAVNQAAAVM